MRNLASSLWKAFPANWRTSSIGGFFVACYHLPDQDWYALKWHCTLIARTARLRLVAAGFPLRRQLLVLQDRRGSDAIGLFSEFITVLGLLEHYEQWARQYAGVHVDFAQGLYCDPRFGANWWEYYFEPICTGSTSDAIGSVANRFQRDFFTSRGERLSRRRGFELIERYIRPKPHIRDKVEAYVREFFQDVFVVGIHYRGTDKYKEAPVVPYERVCAAVLDAIKTAGSARYKLFLATDEQAFLDYMRNLYPGVLLFREMFRSVDGRPIDVVNEDRNHKKGEDAVIDCLLLSRVNLLIRTASSLSQCSTFLNPTMPEIALNREC
jgi:hypothetical protein